MLLFTKHSKDRFWNVAGRTSHFLDVWASLSQKNMNRRSTWIGKKGKATFTTTPLLCKDDTGLNQRIIDVKCSKTHHLDYPEDVQLRQIKSPDFYDRNAHARRYFYYIDLQGRLFLEDAKPKNIATSIKSDKFLQFFFRQLRPNPTFTPAQSCAQGNSTEEIDHKEDDLAIREYPFCSPCGKEMNYIKVADQPVVFSDLLMTPSEKQEGTSNDGRETLEMLVYGGGLKMRFRPDDLRLSTSEGRLYHRVNTKHLHNKSFGLLRSHLAVELSQHIHVSDVDGKVAFMASQHHFKWHGKLHPLQTLDQ